MGVSADAMMTARTRYLAAIFAYRLTHFTAPHHQPMSRVRAL